MLKSSVLNFIFAPFHLQEIRKELCNKYDIIFICIQKGIQHTHIYNLHSCFFAVLHLKQSWLELQQWAQLVPKVSDMAPSLSLSSILWIKISNPYIFYTQGHQTNVTNSVINMIDITYMINTIIYTGKIFINIERWNDFKNIGNCCISSLFVSVYMCLPPRPYKWSINLNDNMDLEPSIYLLHVFW